ncbi:hypothetical protein Tco_0766730 [Tanacetum coccineum]
MSKCDQDLNVSARYSLKYRYIVQSYRGRTQSLVAKKKDISENRASRNFDLMIDKKWCLLKITLQAPFLNVQMTFEHSSSSLGHQCLMMSDHNSSDLAPQRQMVSAENNTSGPNFGSKTTTMEQSCFKAGSKSCSVSKQALHLDKNGITILPSVSQKTWGAFGGEKDNRWQYAPRPPSINQNALIESRAKRSIKISLGHIPFQTLVEHHQVHKLLSRVLRNIIVIFARTSE